MNQQHRRDFIRQSAMAVAGLALVNMPMPLFAKKNQPKLSFSTLGCPKWSLPEIVKFASANHYQGIEIRTIQGEMDLYKCPDFSDANIQASKRMIADYGLQITDLGSSATMHNAEQPARKNNIEEAKKFIDLAARLDAHYIRVFPDKLPTDDSRAKTLDLICGGLMELGTYTKGGKVKVLIESHGDLVKTDELYYVMKNTEQYNVAMIWDIFNMWSVTKEPPAMAYAKLKKYIKHVHVKDAIFINGKEQYVLLGQGEAPIKTAIQLLYQGGYQGFYSFEWEKVWHPEIAEPEIAIAQYPMQIMQYFK